MRLFLLYSLLMTSIDGLKPLNWKRMILDERSASELIRKDPSDDVLIDYVVQLLDHFDPDIKKTFLQRFFYSGRHVSDDASRPTYAFLCVGGEGPALDESVLIDSVHCSGDMLELASRLGANVHLYALEHRYYGESYPEFHDENGNSVPALKTANLKYLSSKQALADLAHFVRTRALPNDCKWVTFGGSYPGFLAAQARSLYPRLVHAAVSSSAPMQFVVDFGGYKERQAYDILYDKIGGSVECLSIVQQGHRELAQRLPDEYEAIGEQFQLCNATQLLEERNLQLFLGDGVVEIDVQNNDPSCTAEICNVDKICRFLEDKVHSGSSALDSLAFLAGEQANAPCINLSWKDVLSSISSTEITEGHWRSWIWQTCTEVGYYQTCEQNSLCPFGRGYHNLDMDYEICDVVFNISDDQVRENIRQMTQFYGDLQLRATRILSVNGDVDPWSVLALLETDDPQDLPTVQVPGASHHFWTHPVKATDGPEIQYARDVIYLQVQAWLEDGVMAVVG